MMTQEERRVTFPEDVMQAAIRYADVERSRLKKQGVDELILRMVTGKSVIQKIVLNEVQKRGHYVGKVKQG
jgi:hypothetical protein